MTIGGLGSGLDFLYDENATEVQVKKTLRVSELEPNRDQPRKQFSDEAIQTLADSIQQYGMIQPILVRPLGLNYQIVAGERRWRAARMLGMDEVPVVIRELTDEETMAVALIENLQREDLNPLEEANAYAQLMDMFHLTQEEVAKRVGKSRSAVANSLRLLKLPSDVLESLRQNGLTERHGRALLRLPNPVAQRAALEYIVDNGLTVNGNIAGQGSEDADLDGVAGSSSTGSSTGSRSAAGRTAACSQNTGSSHNTGSSQKVTTSDHLFHSEYPPVWKYLQKMQKAEPFPQSGSALGGFIIAPFGKVRNSQTVHTFGGHFRQIM